MHPKNVPFVIVVSLILGGIFAYCAIHNDMEMANLLFVGGAVVCGYMLSWAINKQDIITADQFRVVLNGIQAELHAHRQDHDIRAYDPKSVGMQLTTLTAEVTKLSNMINSRISRGKKADPASEPHRNASKSRRSVRPSAQRPDQS